ncbi:hypothetical protein ABBQ32_009506 [Trebouxia sp. C0010 RCD-2024]
MVSGGIPIMLLKRTKTSQHISVAQMADCSAAMVWCAPTAPWLRPYSCLLHTIWTLTLCVLIWLPAPAEVKVQLTHLNLKIYMMVCLLAVVQLYSCTQGLWLSPSQVGSLLHSYRVVVSHSHFCQDSSVWLCKVVWLQPAAPA